MLRDRIITVIIFCMFISGCSKENKPDMTFNTYNQNEHSLSSKYQSFASIGLFGEIEEITTYNQKKELLLILKGLGLIQKKEILPNNDIRYDYIDIEKTSTPPTILIDCETTFIETDTGEQLDITNGCNDIVKITTSKNKEFPIFITFSYPKKEFKYINISFSYKTANNKKTEEKTKKLYSNYSKTPQP